MRVRLRLPCPPARGNKAWGDYYFGHSLARALVKRGHRVLISYSISPKKRRIFAFRYAHGLLQAWRCFWFKPDIDFALRGNHAFVGSKRRKNVMWLISSSRSVMDEELKSYDHVFVASTSYLEVLKARGLRNVSLLLQCTDPNIFFPRPIVPDLACECLFVGNNRNFPRISLDYALQMGVQLKVWGRRWAEKIPPSIYAGNEINNANLGDHYSSARLVLNDHTADMAQDGFTSNRIFDVLACGVPIVSDSPVDLPDELASQVYVFSDYESFTRAVQSALAEDESRRVQRMAAAKIIGAEHGFENRAEEIESVALGLLKKECA